MKTYPIIRLLAASFLGFTALPLQAGISVSTDFEGGSAIIESIDTESRIVRFMPGGDPQRGWPCWWYLRVDGLPAGESMKLELHGSDKPARDNGENTGKPLSPNWAMPARATFSSDGETWSHSEPGAREAAKITYEITGTGTPLWIAWGPPFTSRDTESLLIEAEKTLPRAAKAFELARSREGRPVRGLVVSEPPDGKAKRGVWIQARQHAWESGASWVARGFTEWLVSDDTDACWLRIHGEVTIIPVMDVDNVATGNGGKEAAPRDHNRDWDEMPVYPEVSAAQERLLSLAGENRLAVFLDLHNPGANDARPFFFLGPPELLAESGRLNRERFLAASVKHIDGPLTLDPKPRVTGQGYHPLWKQISGQWVTEHGNPDTMAACLETSWNTRHSTTDGYREVGRQLGRAVVELLRGQ